MRKRLAIGVLALLVAPSVGAQPPSLREDPIPLYLSTAANAGGFSDPDKTRTDSMKDLAEALGKKKSIRMVPAREGAVLVLEVVNRGVREDSGNYSKMFGGKNEVKIVRVKLTVLPSNFTADLSGESAGGGMKGGPGRGAWTKAAYKVADQVDKWVQENEAQLRSAKAAPVIERPTPAPSPSAPPQ